MIPTYKNSGRGWKEDLAEGNRPIPENQRTPCWACGSKNYKQTTRIESCPDCGIEIDYWSGQTNDKYKAAEANREAAEYYQRWCEDEEEDDW